MAIDRKKFVAALNMNALPPFGEGICAKHVRIALEAAGVNSAGHPVSAEDYRPFLEKVGFAVRPRRPPCRKSAISRSSGAPARAFTAISRGTMELVGSRTSCGENCIPIRAIVPRSRRSRFIAASCLALLFVGLTPASGIGQTAPHVVDPIFGLTFDIREDQI